MVALVVLSLFASGLDPCGPARTCGLGATIPAVLVLCAVFAGAIVLRTTSGAMRGFASPLRAVMEAADRVADGDYGVRIEESGAPPMRALAHSFNTMTERLQNADRVRRDLMADVAHELRTPLSVLQGRLEGLLDGVYPRDERQISQLLDEAHVLSRLIDDLRTLALSDAGALPLQMEPTDLVSLAQDVVRSLQPEATRKSVALRVAASTEERCSRPRSSSHPRSAHECCRQRAGPQSERQRRHALGPGRQRMVLLPPLPIPAGECHRKMLRACSTVLRRDRIAWLGSGLDDRKGHRHGARRRNHRVESSRRGNNRHGDAAALARFLGAARARPRAACAPAGCTRVARLTASVRVPPGSFVEVPGSGFCRDA